MFKIVLMAFGAVVLMLSVSATATNAATIDFASSNTGTAVVVPLPAGDENEGDRVLELIGIEGRIDPLIGFALLQLDIAFGLGSTPGSTADFYEQIRVDFFDRPDPVVQTLRFGPLTETNGVFTGTVNTELYDIEPGTGFWARISPADADGDIFGIAQDAPFSVFATLSGVSSFDTGGGNGGHPDVAPIPLPAAGWLLLAGIGALGLVRRRHTAMA
jgi:hypothetical protein